MRSFPTARKLLAAAPLTLAIACGHAAAPRVTSMPAPLVAAGTATPVAASTTPVAVPLVADAPPPVEVASTPMCDGQGRPLAGNVKRKDARSCTLEERGQLAAAENR
jgi:hypothetical protein